jgi:hypothetical protein
MYGALMARPDLTEEDAKSVVMSHLTLCIYTRNDLAVAELLDTAGKRGYLEGDDGAVVDLIRRLIFQGRKRYDEFSMHLLSRLEHPAGETMSYDHKVKLLAVYTAMAKTIAAVSATSAEAMRGAAQATFNQIDLDGQRAGLWPRVYLLEAIASACDPASVAQAEDLRGGLLTDFPDLPLDALNVVSSIFVRAYSRLLKVCPVDERKGVISHLLRHLQDLVRSGIVPDRRTTSELIHGLASAPETEPACALLYDKIEKQVMRLHQLSSSFFHSHHHHLTHTHTHTHVRARAHTHTHTPRARATHHRYISLYVGVNPYYYITKLGAPI